MIFDRIQEAHTPVRIIVLGRIPTPGARLFTKWRRSPAEEGCVCAGLADGILHPGCPRHISVEGELSWIVRFSSVVIRSDDVSSSRCNQPRFYHAVSSRHYCQQQVGECKTRTHEATANFEIMCARKWQLRERFVVKSILIETFSDLNF